MAKRIVLCLIFFGPLAPAISQEDDIETLGSFNVNGYLASSLEADLISDYLQIVEDQKKSIRSVKRQIRKASDSIRDDRALSPSQKIKKLTELRERQENELNDVLLPDQRELFKGFPFYASILDDGFANSMVNGGLAIYLDLSVDERKKIRGESIKAYADYQQLLTDHRNQLVKHQKKTIARLRDALPEEKRELLDKFIKPMLRGNGTIMDDGNALLKIKKQSVLGIPPINDDGE